MSNNEVVLLKPKRLIGAVVTEGVDIIRSEIPARCKQETSHRDLFHVGPQFGIVVRKPGIEVKVVESWYAVSVRSASDIGSKPIRGSNPHVTASC
jgi:hypothetical protein